MKVYKLDFYYFDGVNWETKYIEITALSKIQLMKAFLNEVRWLHPNRNVTQKQEIKDLWNKEKKYITEETLIFPIVVDKTQSY